VIGKLPWLAALLSLFVPGLGQMYNADVKKGVLMLLLFFTLLLAMLAPLAAILMVWAVADAWFVAGGRARRW